MKQFNNSAIKNRKTRVASDGWQMTKKGFTLLELLIVIGIIAILAAIVIIVINPAEWMRRSRDTKRLADLNSLNHALTLAFGIDPGLDPGTATTVYVSLPDNSSDTCDSWDLPDLPLTWNYKCADDDHLQKVDGSGWIPVNFASLPTGSPLSNLPIDPVNASSTGLYYTYNIGGSWKLTAELESSQSGHFEENDGGIDPTVYEVGNPALNPHLARETPTPTPTPTPTYTLAVTKSGAGDGTVTSVPGGINCGSSCSYGFEIGGIVVLTAAGDASSIFTGWSGSGCSGTGTCSVLMDGNKTVDAAFASTLHASQYLFIGTPGPTYYRLHLDDFNTVDTLVGVAGDRGESAAIDLVRRKALFVGQAWVTFIDIDTFIITGRVNIPLGAAEVIKGSIIIDQAAGKAYVNKTYHEAGVCLSSCTKLYRIDIPTMAIDGEVWWDLNADKYLGASDTYSGVMAIKGDTLYAGAYTVAGSGCTAYSHGFAKVNLTTFTKAGVICDSNLYSTSDMNAGVDLWDKNGNLYTVNYDSTNRAIIHKFAGVAGGIAWDGYIQLSAGSYFAESPQVMDTAGQYLAAITDQGGNTPVRLSRINVDTFSVDAEITLPAGNGSNRGSAYDSSRGVFYITVIGGVWKIQMNPFATVIKKVMTGTMEGMVID